MMAVFGLRETPECTGRGVFFWLSDVIIALGWNFSILMLKFQPS